MGRKITLHTILEMENIKSFLKRNPSVKEIHFDEDGHWLYAKAPNHEPVKTMSREEILNTQDPKEPKAIKSAQDAKEPKE